MPKGKAYNPESDRRHFNKGPGKKPTLPAGTRIFCCRVTDTERSIIKATLATLRTTTQDDAPVLVGQEEETGT